MNGAGTVNRIITILQDWVSVACCNEHILGPGNATAPKRIRDFGAAQSLAYTEAFLGSSSAADISA